MKRTRWVFDISQSAGILRTEIDVAQRYLLDVPLLKPALGVFLSRIHGIASGPVEDAFEDLPWEMERAMVLNYGTETSQLTFAQYLCKKIPGDVAKRVLNALRIYIEGLITAGETMELPEADDKIDWLDKASDMVRLALRGLFRQKKSRSASVPPTQAEK